MSCPKEQLMHLDYESPDGEKSKYPLHAGGTAIGTIEIYRRIPGGRQLIDTLEIKDGLCEFSQR